MHGRNNSNGNGNSNSNSKIVANPLPSLPLQTPPSAAFQRNLSSAAGSADGSSDHQHLLEKILKKQDALIEAFERRRSRRVSSTTTQKEGIASRSANANANEE